MCTYYTTISFYEVCREILSRELARIFQQSTWPFRSSLYSPQDTRLGINGWRFPVDISKKVPFPRKYRTSEAWRYRFPLDFLRASFHSPFFFPPFFPHTIARSPPRKQRALLFVKSIRGSGELVGSATAFWRSVLNFSAAWKIGKVFEKAAA